VYIEFVFWNKYHLTLYLELKCPQQGTITYQREHRAVRPIQLVQRRESIGGWALHGESQIPLRYPAGESASEL